MTAGFQNAAAILIFFSQLDPMLGFSQHVPVFAIPSHIGLTQPLTLAVGIATCALILNGAKITKTVPQPSSASSAALPATTCSPRSGCMTISGRW